MGRGNWFPHPRHERNWKMVYVEYNHESYENEDGELVEDSGEFWYDDFKENLRYCLPKSFVIKKERKWVDWDRDVLLFAENELYDILLTDNEWSLAVVIMTKEDAPAFADSCLNKTYDYIAYELWKMYDLNVYSGPWTSSRWVLPNEFRKVRVWDNGGKTNDRYTVMISENEDVLYGMNDMPFHPALGFSQYVGENLKPNKNWGKEIRLTKLNEDVLQAIKQRFNK